MNCLYLTADTIGMETGGGVVTRHESDALRHFAGSEITVWDRSKLDSLDGEEPWKWDVKAHARLTAAGQEKFDLCHIYGGTWPLAVAELKRQGTVVVVTIAAHDVAASRKAHEDVGLPFPYPHLTEPDLWARYIEGYRLADVIVCPSSVAAGTVRAYGPDFKDKDIRVIPHGCNIPFRVTPLPQRFVVGYLGSYGADKGVIDLVRAWKKLSYPDALLILAGRDSTSDFVYRMVKMVGGGAVHLAGWQHDVSDFYNQLSLYVQPSRCLLPGSPVYSSRGVVSVDELTASDSVLDNEGLFRKVVMPLRRSFCGELLSVLTVGIGVSTPMTPSHRVLAIRRGLQTRLFDFERKVEKYEEAKRLKASGMSGVAISKAIGVKYSTVAGWVYYNTKPEGRRANRSLREDVLASSGPKWIAARDLEVGDVVIFPRVKERVRKDEIELPKREVIGSAGNSTKRLPDFLELDSEAMTFFGYYVAEGMAAQDGAIAFCFHKKETQYISDVCNIVSSLGLRFRVRPHKTKNSCVVWIHSVLLAKLLRDNFGDGAHNKTIPHWVVSLPDDQLIPFVRGAWRGDGSVFRTGEGLLRGSYSTVSRNLAYLMFSVLVKLGYMPKLTKNKVRGFSVCLFGRDVIRFSREVMGEVVRDTLVKDCPRTYIDDDYYYVPVRSITKVAYRGDVFNLEVDESRCYSAPFVVHNSEGFGIEVVEAMAHGRSVVCSQGAGAWDCIAAGGGWMYPAGDVDQLALCIANAYRHRDRLQAPGERNRAGAAEYSWDRVRQSYQDLWWELMYGPTRVGNTVLCLEELEAK